MFAVLFENESHGNGTKHNKAWLKINVNGYPETIGITVRIAAEKQMKTYAVFLGVLSAIVFNVTRSCFLKLDVFLVGRYFFPGKRQKSNSDYFTF